MLNWFELSPPEFELVVLRLVEAVGFEGATKIAGPGDRGNDVVAFLPDRIPGVEPRSRKFVFQCKRVRHISKGNIAEELANFVGERIDTWILVAPITPSPEFRSWVSGLGRTANYQFHVQAWWLDELERYARQYGDALRRYVPELAAKLGLVFGGFGEMPHGIEAILARSRHQVQTQIRQFARGKYIPDLYVRRSLEDDLTRFLQTEPETAASLRERLLARAEGLHAQVIAYPAHFRTYLNGIEAQSRDPRRKQERERLATAELLAILNGLSSEWHREMVEALDGFVRTLRDLPANRHVHVEAEYERVHEWADRCLAQLKQVPRESMHGMELTYLGIEDAPQVRVLVEGIINELEAFRRLGLLVVDRAGSGKTNLLCHMAAGTAEQQPTLLFFGKQQLIGVDSLVLEVTRAVDSLVPYAAGSALDELNEVLGRDGLFLTVFVDGINENRRLPDFDEAVLRLLNWAIPHRIKVVLTCRDIYASFFRTGEWVPRLRATVRERLNEFSTEEYRTATELYLRHYQLSCTLREEAERACRHPLLLRFFCEAYGEIDGSLRTLGVIRDIKLKELFSVYLSRKLEQIREVLGHRDTRLIHRFVQEVALRMFHTSSGVLSLEDIENVTGERDTSTHNSIYVRLLDEDIILEEHPGGGLDEKRVSFVYEEFMEFLLARSLLSIRMEGASVGKIFALLESSNQGWANARGVAEYVGLMLLEGDYERTRPDAISFLSMMLSGGEIWFPAFWGVIAKCPERCLGHDLFDLFPAAIPGLKSQRVVQSLLGVSSRLSESAAAVLAEVILWSAVLPNVLTWKQLKALPEMGEDEVEALGGELLARLSFGEKYAPPSSDLLTAVFDGVRAFLTEEAKAEIEKLAQRHGTPSKVEESTRVTMGVLRVIWKAFPDAQPRLLNGLFCEDESVRTICADRLRFVSHAQTQIHHLCRILQVAEHDTAVGEILRRVS